MSTKKTCLAVTHAQKFCLIASFALASASANALQTVEPVEGHNAFVKISAKETTRIAVEGGKIRSMFATDGELTVEKDEDRGQLFIRPVILDKPINIRLVASSGATYNLVMQAVDIPQEDIIIREPFAAKTKSAGTGKREVGSNLTRTVRKLVAAMALEEPPNSVDFRTTNQEFALWENTRFVMTGKYVERDIVGEKYVLTNTGKSTIRLVEQELYRKGVVAVAIENMQLDAGQTTNIYILRSQ